MFGGGTDVQLSSVLCKSASRLHPTKVVIVISVSLQLQILCPLCPCNEDGGCGILFKTY